MCNSIAIKKAFFKPLVNWDEMQVDGEILEYMAVVAISLYEAKANLE